MPLPSQQRKTQRATTPLGQTLQYQPAHLYAWLTTIVPAHLQTISRPTRRSSPSPQATATRPSPASKTSPTPTLLASSYKSRRSARVLLLKAPASARLQRSCMTQVCMHSAHSDVWTTRRVDNWQSLKLVGTSETTMWHAVSLLTSSRA